MASTTPSAMARRRPVPAPGRSRHARCPLASRRSIQRSHASGCRRGASPCRRRATFSSLTTSRRSNAFLRPTLVAAGFHGRVGPERSASLAEVPRGTARTGRARSRADRHGRIGRAGRDPYDIESPRGHPVGPGQRGREGGPAERRRGRLCQQAVRRQRIDRADQHRPSTCGERRRAPPPSSRPAI